MERLRTVILRSERNFEASACRNSVAIHPFVYHPAIQEICVEYLTVC